MKRIILLSSLISILSALYPAAAAQEAPKVCKFNLVGTWQQTTEGLPSSTLLRFNREGTVSVLSHKDPGQDSAWQATDWLTYKIENPEAPTAIHLLPIVKHGEEIPASKVTSLEITKFDDGAFTTSVTSNAGVELTQWVRLDPFRYFVILAAAKGTPGYGAPAFAMLTKTDGRQEQTEAFGLFETDPVHHHVLMGPISEELRKKFENEPRDDSAALLRLEVTAGPFNHALQVLKTWERRAREHTLLYQIPYLDNAVYLNQLVSSLNDCAQTISLEKLTWRIDDPIITKQNLPQVPYFFIKDIRQRNSSLHVKDEKFHEKRQAINLPAAR